MTDTVISQLPDGETLLEWVVGDFLEFWLTITDPDPDSPDPDNPDMIVRNLTGWTVAAQIRKSTKKTDPKLAEFIFDDLDESGEVHAMLTDVESSKLDGIRAGRWDLQLTNPAGQTQTIVLGPAQPAGQVTRDE